MKGDGEVYFYFLFGDEFVDFEIWDVDNISWMVEKRNEMFEYEYVWFVFKFGLVIEEKIGVNFFKFGMIVSIDLYMVMLMVDDDNFFGKFRDLEFVFVCIMLNMGVGIVG